MLYHATYRKHLASILEHGLGGHRATAANWDFSKSGVVCLSTDPFVAESFAETSDLASDEDLDSIVLLEIDEFALEPHFLMPDGNIRDDNEPNANQTDARKCFEYAGVIPISAITQTTPAHAAFLDENGYTNRRTIAGEHCGLSEFAFTTGLVVGLHEWGYRLRYCFEHKADALAALQSWDGNGHPQGPWIKCKGAGIDLLNPELGRDRVGRERAGT